MPMLTVDEIQVIARAAVVAWIGWPVPLLVSSITDHMITVQSNAVSYERARCLGLVPQARDPELHGKILSGADA